MFRNFDPWYSVFIGSTCFIGSITGLIFGPSGWQLLGSLVGAAITVYFVSRPPAN